MRDDACRPRDASRAADGPRGARIPRPTPTRGRVLLVDDDPSLCELLEAGLSGRGFAPSSRCGAAEALAALKLDTFDVVLTDLNMEGIGGIELCERVIAAHPAMPVVVMTGSGTIALAVAAIRAGAYDFVTKPLDLDALGLTLERTLRHKDLSEEVERLREAVDDVKRFEGLLGASPAMRKVYDLLERVGSSDASVLITGESGTGKEVVARALHRRGTRSAGPFVALNCAAMTETLLESELFGHARGAFTDAKTAHAGLMVQADGGTLFLDEIGELPLALQPKILRALQERRVRPVGGNGEVRYDARIIAATNRDIEVAVEERRFREDLYFRINVIHVAMPPLRSRGGDVMILAQRFLALAATHAGNPVRGMSDAAARQLLAYNWPGNVRELQNCIERAVAVTRSAELVLEDLPEKIRDYRPSHFVVAGDDPSELVPLDEVQRRYVLRVVEAVGGNKSMAARVLRLDRKTLYRMLDRYGGVGPKARAPS